MRREKAVLSLMVIVLLGSQWLMPGYIGMGSFPYSPAQAAHSHGDSQPTMAPLQSSCCRQDGTPSFHEDLCCEATAALPSALADLSSYTPYQPLTVVEPHEKSALFLAPPWHPPTV